jgi:hypothetical protein
MRFLLSLVFLCGFAMAHADDQQPRVTSIEILEVGTYEARQVPKLAGGNGAPEQLQRTTDANITNSTTTVRARVGVRFGFRYRLIGEPLGGVVDLTLVVKYPSPGLRDPANSQPMAASEVPIRRTIGDIHHFGFTFENGWEVAPGIWTFEIWRGDPREGERLVEQEFQIIAR